MNNEALAKYFEASVPQIVCVWPLVWKHLPAGDWFVLHCFDDGAPGGGSGG